MPTVTGIPTEATSGSAGFTTIIMGAVEALWIPSVTVMTMGPNVPPLTGPYGLPQIVPPPFKYGPGGSVPLRLHRYFEESPPLVTVLEL